MRTPHQELIATELLPLLENRKLTIKDIADELGQNYYSVRLVVQSMLEEGVLVRADNYFRNSKVMIATAGTANKIVPSIDLGGTKHNLVSLLGLRYQTTTNAAKAISRFPMHITRILHAAIKIDNGDNQERSLRLIKTEMRKDLEHLRNAIHMYEQVIENPVNWNVDTLKRFVNDPRFDLDEIRASYSFFFEQSKDTTDD